MSCAFLYKYIRLAWAASGALAITVATLYSPLVAVFAERALVARSARESVVGERHAGATCSACVLCVNYGPVADGAQAPYAAHAIIAHGARLAAASRIV